MNGTVQLLVGELRYLRHQLMLSAAVLIGFILSSCGQDVQSVVQDAPTPDIISSEVKPSIRISKYEKAVNNDKIFNGLDLEDFTSSELAELKALQAKQTEAIIASRKAMENLTLKSGELKRTTLSKDESERLWILQYKHQTASYRKSYKHYMPEYLSQNELNELVALYQKVYIIEKTIEKTIEQRKKITFNRFSLGGLSPSEGLSASELAEYKALQTKRHEGVVAYSNANLDRHKQDPEVRGLNINRKLFINAKVNAKYFILNP